MIRTRTDKKTGACVSIACACAWWWCVFMCRYVRAFVLVPYVSLSLSYVCVCVYVRGLCFGVCLSASC